jgi:MacB-like periplasmic core domain
VAWGIDTFVQDLKFALRTLARDRAFTVLAVVILGIGANVAVFSVVNRIVLRPLPFAGAVRLVWLIGGQKLDSRLREAAGLGAVTYQVDVFEEFQRHNRSFESVTSFNPFYGSSEYTLTDVGQPQGVAGVMVAGNFFQTLGVEPALGAHLRGSGTAQGRQPGNAAERRRMALPVS